MDSREKIRKHISDRQVRFMLNEEEDILTALLNEHTKEAIEAHEAETCAWEYSDPDYNEWSSMCGASFRFDDGTALENGMKRCIRCGKIVVETINPNIDYENDDWKE